MPSLYDRMSRGYDLLSASEHPLVEAGLRRLGVCPGERVLEIGPGTGYALPSLAAAVQPGGCVFGLDRSPGMLRAAGARLRRSRSVAGLIHGDAIRLPFATAVFDKLFLSFTLELFEDPVLPGILGECRRVLRPAGSLGVVTLLEASQPGWMSRVYGWCHTRFPRVIDCRPIAVAGWLTRAGFQINSLETYSLWGLPVAVAIATRPDDRDQV